jgi:hypothetical protein
VPGTRADVQPANKAGRVIVVVTPLNKNWRGQTLVESNRPRMFAAPLPHASKRNNPKRKAVAQAMIAKNPNRERGSASLSPFDGSTPKPHKNVVDRYSTS